MLTFRPRASKPKMVRASRSLEFLHRNFSIEISRASTTKQPNKTTTKSFNLPPPKPHSQTTYPQALAIMVKSHKPPQQKFPQLTTTPTPDNRPQIYQVPRPPSRPHPRAAHKSRSQNRRRHLPSREQRQRTQRGEGARCRTGGTEQRWSEDCAECGAGG